jgi:Arc/MetJ-type ribon-helix-helix transcriptional regulator
MAIPKIKATYSLDEDTVRLLERVAGRWGVSKSEALRRAIRVAADADTESSPALQTLNRIQDGLGLTTAVAAAWARQARAERRATARARGKP